MNAPIAMTLRDYVLGSLYSVLARIKTDAEEITKNPGYLRNDGQLERATKAQAIAGRLAEGKHSGTELAVLYNAEIDVRAKIAKMKPEPSELEKALMRLEAYGSVMEAEPAAANAEDSEYAKALEILYAEAKASDIATRDFPDLADEDRQPIKADDAGQAESVAETSPRRGRPAARDQLLKELDRLDLRLGRDGEKVLAKVTRDGYVATHVVGTRSLHRLLLVIAEAAHIPISRNSLDEVEDRLLARGFSPSTPKVKSYIRVGRDDRDASPLLLNTIIDPGREDWKALRISFDGIRMIDSTDPESLWFIRPVGFQALAEPDLKNPDLSRIWRYINLTAEDDQLLFLAWMVHTFRTGQPSPLLAFIGEQGGAKSSSCRAIKEILDPSEAPLLSLPRDERDLFSLVECGYIIVFDNCSRLEDWLSDLFAAVVTGAGRIVRALYTDSEARLFRTMKALVVNGISDFIVRGDLLDRAVLLTPPPIPEKTRKTESDLHTAFINDLPAILGGLYTLIARVIGLIPSVHLREMTRMADFCETGEAVAIALSHDPGYFGAAYKRNIAASNDVALEASLVAGAVQKIVLKGEWQGTPASLLTALGEEVGEQGTRSQRWPRNPAVLTSELKRIGPALRRVSIEIEIGRKHEGRFIRIYRVQQEEIVVTVDTASRPQSELGLEPTTSPAVVQDSPFTDSLPQGYVEGVF
jgi:hypothetical protein